MRVLLEKSMQRMFVALVLALSLGVAGCSSKPVKPSAPAESANAGAAAGASTAGDNAASAAAGADDEAAGPQSGLLATRVIYFDFDSSEIKDAGVDVVAAHAKYLAAHPSTRVRLEGHTDERGSREYNIGLGERRAQAVRRALMLQGATEGQITTVSYGEERPAVTGHDEQAWSKNRRVEVVYLSGAGAPAAAGQH
jgi:peptidoglycan-associated lipoprotein